MIKFFIAVAMVAAFSLAAFGQTANFTGTWVLDVSRSKFDRAPLESMTMTVVQSGTEIKVKSTVRRPPLQKPGAPAEIPQGLTTKDLEMRALSGFDIDSDYTFALDGKDKAVKLDGPGGSKIPVVLRGFVKGGTAILSATRDFPGPDGDMPVTTADVWTLTADGTLSIKREHYWPGFSSSSTLIFVRN
jgi:hypothetical protein